MKWFSGFLDLLPRNEVRELELDLIWTEEQPRRDLGDISSLAASIKRCGLLQPVVVVQREAPHAPERKFLLVAGERRLRACQSLGWKTLRAVILPPETPEEDVRLIQMVENLQRKALLPSEEARGLARVMEALLGLAPEEAALAVQYVLKPSRRVVRRRESVEACRRLLSALDLPPKRALGLLRLLRFPAWVQEAVDRGEIPLSRLEGLLRLAGDEDALRRALPQTRKARPASRGGETSLEEALRELDELRKALSAAARRLEKVPPGKRRRLEAKLRKTRKVLAETLSLLREL